MIIIHKFRKFPQNRITLPDTTFAHLLIYGSLHAPERPPYKQTPTNPFDAILSLIAFTPAQPVVWAGQRACANNLR